MNDLRPPTGSPRLTLAMIVKNGGQDLVSLLEEARPWVDERVVGDTGSTDGSPRAAADAGARVLEVSWRDDFAAARNAVLAECRGAWILCLDADERIAPDDWRTLRRWVDDSPRGMFLRRPG